MDTQIDFTKLSNKSIMLLWLLDYDISHNPIDIFLTMKYYDIPFSFFFWKYVARAKLASMTADKIYSSLVEMNVVSIENFNHDSKVLMEIIQLVDKHGGLTPAGNITGKLIDQLDKIVPYITDQGVMHKIHRGQPVPDPEKGRPYINWKQCKYFGCNMCFNTADGLIDHLKYYSCYTERFHWYHEFIVMNHLLTPEKVIKDNMTACPSLLCSKYKFNTPEDLIQHFIELGIEPFWEPGMVVMPNNLFTSFNTIEISKGKFYIAEECIVCLSEKPNIINIPCMHKIYCIDCWLEGNFNKCAVCKFNIERVIPNA
jgi:hypothetical protein